MFDIEREIKETRVRLCLDCGKCTVVCPVAQYDQEFNPRLIIQRRLAGHDHYEQDDTIWRCLDCRMCFERCNYHVRFPEFIRTLRSEAILKGTQVQYSHGGTLQTLMHMMAHNGGQLERLGWLSRDIVLQQGETLFFVGCAPYFDSLFKDIGVKTLDAVNGALSLLNLAKMPFNLSASERCCGRDLLLQGDREGFKALARANMNDFAARNIKKIITNCPECYYTLKIDYPLMFGNTNFEVMHLTEVIAPMIQNKTLSLGTLKKRVAYHDPCTLGRGLRVFDAPRQILGAISGLKIVEMEHNREQSLCCGASAWVHCGAVNRRIQEQRISEANAVEADVLVTACPKCLIHLKCAQKCQDSQISSVEIQDLSYLAVQSLNRR